MRKIAIVGAAITEEELHERAKGYELWSVNNLYAGFLETEFSRWYELHYIDRIGRRYRRRGFPNYPISREQPVREYLKRINELKCPVYMQKKWRFMPKSRVFPFEDIVRYFGTSYFGCSFTWMLAHAMMELVDHVGFFGVALTGNEYFYQRPSLEYFIGRAQEQGIEIHIDESSNLLKANYIYAWKEDFDMIYMLHGEFAQDVALTTVNAVQSRIAEMNYGK